MRFTSEGRRHVGSNTESSTVVDIECIPGKDVQEHQKAIFVEWFALKHLFFPQKYTSNTICCDRWG
jgi:hypothetical protein